MHTPCGTVPRRWIQIFVFLNKGKTGKNTHNSHTMHSMLKGQEHEIFELCFFHKLVVPSPLIPTLKYFHHLLRFHRVIGPLKKICVYKTRKFLNLHVSIHGYFLIFVYWNMKIQKFMCFIHGDFWISVYWNTEIGKYEQFCLTKPPCFSTRRFFNLHVLKHGDSKTWTVLPYKTSIHGDFWISVYWNTEIQKSAFLNQGDFWNLLVLKHRD